jgi:hypothetical protein
MENSCHITKVPEIPARSWDKVTYPCHGIDLKNNHIVLFFSRDCGVTVKAPETSPDKEKEKMFEYLRTWNREYFIPAPIGTTSTFTTID